jgi:hypothetical protein
VVLRGAPVIDTREDGVGSADQSKPVREEPKFLTDYRGDFSPVEMIEKFKLFALTTDEKILRANATKHSVKFIAKAARDEGMSLAGFLETRQSLVPPFLLDEPLETGIVRITKTHAEFKVRNKYNGNWIGFLAIKEGGVWKIAPAELFDEVMKEVDELFNRDN